MFVAPTNRPSIFPFSSIKSTVFNGSQRVVATTGLFWHSWENTWLSRTNNVTGKEREKAGGKGSGKREWELELNLVPSCASACSWSCAFISFIRWFPKRLKIEFVVFNERREQLEFSLSPSLARTLSRLCGPTEIAGKCGCSAACHERTHSPSLSLFHSLRTLCVCACVRVNFIFNLAKFKKRCTPK